MSVLDNTFVKTNFLKYATTYHKVKRSKMSIRILCSIPCCSFLIGTFLISIA